MGVLRVLAAGFAEEDDDDDDVADLGVGRTMNVDLNLAEAASNGADEERELMLLQAAEHVKMARSQRALYQAKVADAVADAISRLEYDPSVNKTAESYLMTKVKENSRSVQRQNWFL